VVAGGIAAGVLLGGSPASGAAGQGRGGTSLVSAAFGSQGTLRAAHGRYARFELRGGHGRPKIDVYAALEGAGSPIGLTIEGPGERVEYMARGFAGARRLKASFGGLGEVDLSFRPSGRVLRAPRTDSSCPAGATARLGTFTGRFRLRARAGGPSADARRIEGSIGTAETPVELRGGDLACDFPEPLYRLPIRAQETEGKPPILAAESAIPEGRVALEVAPFLIRTDSPEFHSPPGRPLIVAAGVRKVTEGVTITGVALGGGPERKVLEVGTGGAGAVLTPGAPFSGSATYTGEGSLTGDLAVSMPGLGKIGLAGAGFEATIGG
jgi:hypothetical protein